jgi:hypothetical protein
MGILLEIALYEKKSKHKTEQYLQKSNTDIFEGRGSIELEL